MKKVFQKRAVASRLGEKNDKRASETLCICLLLPLFLSPPLSPSLPFLLPKAPHIFGKIKVSPLILQGTVDGTQTRAHQLRTKTPPAGEQYKLFLGSPGFWQSEAAGQCRASAQQTDLKLTAAFSSSFFLPIFQI